MGNYDVPAVINYVLHQTQQPTLIYIGHSLGAGVFFIGMIKHPELNAKIEMMIAVAPSSGMTTPPKNIFLYALPFAREIEVTIYFKNQKLDRNKSQHKL